MSSKKDFRAPVLLIVLSLIWGTSFTLIKKGISVFSANEVALLRVVSACFFLLPFALNKVRKLQVRDHIKLFFSGLIGILIPSFLFANAQTQLDGSVAGIMNSLTPVWTMIIAVLARLQRFTKYAVIGTIIGFGGVLILMIASAKTSLTLFNPHILLLVASTFLYGCNLNFVKHQIKGIDVLTMTSTSTLLIGLISAIYLFGFTEFTVRLTTQAGAWKAFSAVVVLGLMSTAVAVLLLNRLIKIKTPLYASLTTYLIPIVAIVLGILDGEQMSLGIYLGMVAIIGSLYLINKK